MDYLVHVLAGFGMAFLGLVPPGMLNMTTLRTSLEHGIKPARAFAAGAASVVIIHSGIAVYFATYLNDHPEVIIRLRYLGIAVFLALAVFFFIQARKKFKGQGKDKKGNYFMQGLSMSAINMLGVPFYLGVSTLLEANGWITLDMPFMWYVVGGACLGAFALFMTYAILADKIVSRISFIASNINYILSILFLVLAIVVLVNVI
ncbi:MAG: LysE family transporter [Saprospiraceae bacterium]|nr:LysE family transporter [Saprospiraceae bacterium]